MSTTMIDFFARLGQRRGFLIANVVALFLLGNLAAARLGCRLDWTRDRMNSLSGSTAQVLAGLKEPLLVEAYVSREVPGEIENGIFPLVNILREIDRVGGERVQLSIVDADTDEIRSRAESRGIRGLKIEQRKDAESKVRLAYFGVYMQMGEKTATINLVDGEWFVQDLEYRFLREVKKMTRTGTQSGIALVRVPGTGATERWQRAEDQNKDNYYGFRTLLEEEQGSIRETALSEPVPADVETLLIFGLPRLEEGEVYQLDQFLMRGGNIILLAKGFEFDMRQGDPRMAQLGLGGGEQGIGFATVPEEELRRMNQWLAHYGITVNGEVLLEPTQALPILDLFGEFVRQIPYPAWAVYDRRAGNISGTHPALANVQQLVFPWFSGLDVRNAVQPDVKFETLVQTTGEAVRRANTSLDYEPTMRAGTDPGDTRVGTPQPVAVLARGKFRSGFRAETLPPGADPALFRPGQVGDSVSHLVVLGTPYIVSDVLLKNQTGLQVFGLNRAFLLNLLEAVEGDTDLIEARSRVPQVARILPFFGQSEWFQNLFSAFHILALPLGIALYGALRMLRRNQRRGVTGAQ